MNEYKVTYSNQAGNAQAYIVERSEAAARKAFKAQVKDAEITDIELYNTNVSATKAQERETLEKIKAMVEELGPVSYLKTAFEGVFQDAEDNIDDAAYSMKARYESSEAKLREMSGNYVAAKRSASVLEEQLEKAQAQIEALERRQLPEALRRDIREMAASEAEVSRARMEQTAETMAYYAEAPQDIAFKDAVECYRKEKARRALYDRVVKGLDEIAPEE